MAGRKPGVIIPHVISYVLRFIFVTAGAALPTWWLWRRRRAPGTPQRLFLAMLFLLAAPAWIASTHQPWDDECLRLMLAQSIVTDGDLNLAEDYREERWRHFKEPTHSFFESNAARIDQELRRRGGRAFYAHYAPGDAVINAAGYALGLATGGQPAWVRLTARLPTLLAAAWLITLFHDALRRRDTPPDVALLCSLALALSPPFLFFGARLWPEMLAAAIILRLAIGLDQERTPFASLALGMMAGLLPLLHARYLFLLAPIALCHLFHRSGLRDRALFIVGATFCLLPFAAWLPLRQHAATLEILRAIQFPDPTLTGNAPAFSPAYLSLHSIWERVIAPPAGFLLYAPLVLLAVARRGYSRPMAYFAAALTTVLAAQILLYCAASGPLARYWVPLLPLLLLGLGGPGPIPRRHTFALLLSYGVIRALAFAAWPALAFDARWAAAFAQKLPALLRWLPYVVLG